MDKQEEKPSSDYLIKDGLRWVVPYNFEYTNSAKGRWWGKTLIEIFCKEFPFRTREHYEDEIRQGKFTINGKKVTAEYKFRDRDVVVHTVHRHENPVRDVPIPIVHMSDDMLVVDKPASMPVHACGRYGKNSLCHILENEMKTGRVFGVHRLDRLTSGILVLARTKESATKIAKQIEGKSVRKTYLARVRGKFPSAPSDSSSVDSKQEEGKQQASGEEPPQSAITVDVPLKCINERLGIWGVAQSASEAGAKEAKTKFRLAHYHEESDTSVVWCFPETGRTHQIRIHLKHLGHPIANDTLYGHDGTVTNPPLPTPLPTDDASLKLPLPVAATTASQPPTDAVDQHAGEKRPLDENRENEAASPPPTKKQKISDQPQQARFDMWKDTPYHDSTCPDCSRGEEIPPPPNCMLLFLHALRYEGSEWKYETEWPEWAKEGHDPRPVLEATKFTFPESE